MQPPPLNGAAILVAALLRFAIGFIWWSPQLFGGIWKDSPELKRRMPWAVASGAVTALIMAWVLAHAVFYAAAYSGAHGPALGAMVGFFNWLGFVATVTLMMTFSQPNPVRTWLIQNGYQAISIIAMGVLLAVWP